MMIPGNHDQVSRDGLIHGLDVIAAALARDQVLVFSKPTILRKALWLPFRREENVLSTVLSSASLQGIQTVFCHVDVLGAYKNSGSK